MLLCATVPVILQIKSVSKSCAHLQDIRNYILRIADSSINLVFQWWSKVKQWVCWLVQMKWPVLCLSKQRSIWWCGQSMDYFEAKWIKLCIIIEWIFKHNKLQNAISINHEELCMQECFCLQSYSDISECQSTACNSLLCVLYVDWSRHFYYIQAQFSMRERVRIHVCVWMCLWVSVLKNSLPMS